MKKYGWEWKTEEGAKKFVGILVREVSASLKGEPLKREEVVVLADEMIALEGCFPDSFIILAVIGGIYSESAVESSMDLPLSNELISKAERAQELASKYIIDGQLTDPEETDPFINRVNLARYYTNFCNIGYAKYIQSDCREKQQFLATKLYYEKAIELDPDSGTLKYFGQQMEKLTGSSQKAGGCFVVTAACGNIKSPEVVYLSNFRDNVLAGTINGRRFIDAYYAVSPYFVFIISKSNRLKLITRILLVRPLINLLGLNSPPLAAMDKK